MVAQVFALVQIVFSADRGESDVWVQPVQEYQQSFEERLQKQDGKTIELNPARHYSHLGTDYGPLKTGGGRLSWRSGQVRAVTGTDQTTGMWHSLEGLARETDRLFNASACYPALIHPRFQLQCVGVHVIARGSGKLRLELKSTAEEMLWQETRELKSPSQFQCLEFAFNPVQLRELKGVKFLNWLVLPSSDVTIDAVRLVLDGPRLPLDERLFLKSYAKLARCYLPDDLVVKDRANWSAGQFESVPATGMFCLVTCAASTIGIVERSLASETLHGVHRRISQLPRSHGLLPHFLRKADGAYGIHPGTEYSTIDTSLYYHSMLLAAQLMGDHELLRQLEFNIKEIGFSELRDAEGFVIHGLKDDGRTKLESAWRDWGGETALVLLLQRMAADGRFEPKMNATGRVHRGTGFIAEIQSLFYPQFSSSAADQVTRIDWSAARRQLLREQREYVQSNWPESAAAQAGFFGLSAGEGPGGVGYVADGTDVPGLRLLHPHYMLMTGVLDATGTLARLDRLEQMGFFPPWGLVENVTVDLDESLPMIGSLNASFEALAAYHLWAASGSRSDEIYDAARQCPLTRTAIKVFYPEDSR